MKVINLILIFSVIACSQNDVKTKVAEKIDLNNVIIIDVRSEAEFNSGHVKNAIHIPFQEISSKIESITKDKSKRILLYCASGGRSGMALRSLKEMGYSNATNEGGLSDIKAKLNL